MNIKYTLTIIVLVILVLILTVLFRKRFNNSKGHFLTHFFLYWVEILLVTTTLNYFLYDNNNLSFIDVLKNYVFSYTIYQLILLTTFKLKDALEIDAYTSIKNLLDKYIIYADLNRKIPPDELMMIKEIITRNDVTYSKNHRNYISQIINLAESYNLDQIITDDFKFLLKQKSREVSFLINTFNFGWTNSVLLRLAKN